ncbi:hypothetical protein RUM44_008109 [Polyplax serrata]|uniref:Toll-interacting protein n=1 Tax=Polyplax serrata TaxID=468196 RepID=A0ABR1BBC4_POLSC
MASATDTDQNVERRKRVFVGKLPPDFLRISNQQQLSAQEQQEAADAQAALALQQQLVDSSYSYNLSGKLSITVGQAKLVKNYGMTRMDPYVRLRVGHSVYETHTDPNGGKNPKWNRIVLCLLPHGVNSIYLEIYDECSFKMDELIAWAHIPISQSVMNGETYEDWFPLNGKQGEGVEGVINLVISFVPGQYGIYSPVSSVLMDVANPNYNLRHVPVTYSPSPISQAIQPPIEISEEGLKQMEEMFPNIDKDVVKSVFKANRGNRDRTINSLLQMSE